MYGIKLVHNFVGYHQCGLIHFYTRRQCLYHYRRANMSAFTQLDLEFIYTFFGGIGFYSRSHIAIPFVLLSWLNFWQQTWIVPDPFLPHHFCMLRFNIDTDNHIHRSIYSNCICVALQKVSVIYF